MDISIVVPCYQSAPSLTELYSGLESVLNERRLSWELILVNDASPDNTWQIIQELSQSHSNITGVSLLRNCGQQKATLCGFTFAHGNIVVTMDDDLQHPAAEIVRLYSYLIDHPEIDVVFAAFAQKKHRLYRNFASWMQYRIHRLIFPDVGNLKLTSFRAFRRFIVTELLHLRQTQPYIALMTLCTTTRIANVQVSHSHRKYGKSGYSLAKLFQAASIPLINYSSLPLRIVSIFGLLVSLLSFSLAIVYLFRYIFGRITVPGFTTLILAIMFATGSILFSFGIVGEYLSRIIEQQTMPDHYPVRDVVRSNHP